MDESWPFNLAQERAFEIGRVMYAAPGRIRIAGQIIVFQRAHDGVFRHLDLIDRIRVAVSLAESVYCESSASLASEGRRG